MIRNMKNVNNLPQRSGAQQISEGIVWTNYAKSLKAVAMAGLILGLSDIWLAVNRELIHWPGSTQLLLLTTFVFWFFCFKMIFEGKRSVASTILWIGMAYISIAALFRSLAFTGGMIMEFYGVPNLIIVVAAIIYLTQLPQEQRWSQRVLGLWSIGVPLVSCLLWYAMFIYQNYIDVNTFEPAIPYSDFCVEYIRHRHIRALVLNLGSGIALFLFSLPLYIVARKHNK